jgi:glycosyltransferase involved in cell wall biosynthesis
MKIVGVSDVSIGFGSPQIIAMMRSLLHRYGESEGLIIEPDQPNIEPYEDPDKKINVLRVETAFQPYSNVGRREYCISAAKKINEIQPDVLVIFCTFTLPVLFRLRDKPRLVIYYHLEYAPVYGQFDIQMNKSINKYVDLIIHPEENRAQRDMRECGYKDAPFVIAYNAVGMRDNIQITPPRERNGKILYQGSINSRLTFPDYFTNKQLANIQIDLYGNISGEDRFEIEATFMNLRNDVKYHGYIDSQKLAKIRKQYAYSIVMWNPVDENFLYACPNKFFESIFDGVPPIAAPHPQCKAIIEQFGCGIVMRDWSFDAFRGALEIAQDLYGTPEYDQMVENCRQAALAELNWETQFAKIEKHLT